MLNADELGEKGQSRFKEICADAKLICNQSDRDRTGWDFIVEFPFENASSLPTLLETRETPLSCHVQVKTLLEKNDRFEMRLSSAERLAKELKPSFVYVFKVSETLQVTDAYLVHFLNEPLGKILRRLRKEDVEGNSSPNKSRISMSARIDGVRVDPTGRGLRDALLAAIGSDAHVYVSRKTEQLKTLGFEERPYSTEMTLNLNGVELVDVFLGLKKDVPAVNLRTEHTRFNITMPLPELSDKEAYITIQPSPADSCTITMRSNPLSPPVVFRGKVFLPPFPKLPPELRKALFVTDLFSMTFARNGWTIKSKLSNAPPQTPTVWASYWRLASALATGEGTIQIESDNNPINLSFQVTAKFGELDPDQCKYLTTLCEQVSLILKFAGVLNEPTQTMEDIVRNGLAITAGAQLIHPEIEPVTISFVSALGKIPDVPLRFEAIYVDYLLLGSVAIGYYGLTHVVGNCREDQIEWNTESVALKCMKQLHSFPKQYEEMIEAARRETGCQNIFRGNLNKSAYREPEASNLDGSSAKASSATTKPDNS
jgi:hypothetical protein